MNIVAVDIPENWRDVDETHLSVSEASLSEGDDVMISLYDHQQANAAFLHNLFPRRSLTALDMMSVPSPASTERFNRVHASSLRYRCLNPIIYRQETMIRNESLQHFINCIRRDSPILAEEHTRLWQIVLSDENIISHLHFFEFTIEAEIRDWNLLLCDKILTHFRLRRNVRFPPEVLLGVQGALAYTDPDEDGQASGALIWRAGYLGYCDLAIRKSGRTYAVFEYKKVSDIINQTWYRHGSILPQIICWIGGAASGRVGIVLTNIGYRVIYRVLRPEHNPEGHPIFDYYILFDGNHAESRRFTECRGADGHVGRMQYLRILFEILVSCNFEDPLPVKAPIVKKATRVSKKKRYRAESPPTEEEYRESVEAFLREPLNEDGMDENIDTTNQYDESSSCESEADSIDFDNTISYKFAVSLKDGSFAEYVGYEFL